MAEIESAYHLILVAILMVSAVDTLRWIRGDTVGHSNTVNTFLCGASALAALAALALGRLYWGILYFALAALLYYLIQQRGGRQQIDRTYESLSDKYH